MSNPVVDFVVLVVFVFVGVTILSLLTVAACCVCWILSDFKMRSTFELTSDWNPSMASIRLFMEVFVVTDKLDVDEVEELDDLVLPDPLVFAFLVVVVAISDGGALFDWNIETESSSPLSFTNTCRSPNFSFCSSMVTTISKSDSSRLAMDSSASVVTVPFLGSYVILRPSTTALGVKNR